MPKAWLVLDSASLLYGSCGTTQNHSATSVVASATRVHHEQNKANLMRRLKSYLMVPPGSFRYDEAEWGLHVGSNIEHLADDLMEWRKGNNKPRATFGEALEDIENFTATAIGGNQDWCYDTDVPFNVLRRKAGHGCSTCGAKVK